MGFLDSLFTSNKKESNDEKRLAECVKKISNSEYGVFAQMQEDIGVYSDENMKNDTNLRKMAYAYARRYAAMGLCAQGLWGQKEFDYTYTIFLSFQNNISDDMQHFTYEDSISFQQEANKQAIELMESYDSRLNKNVLMFIANLMSKDASIAQKNKVSYDVDQLLEIIEEYVN